MNVQSRSQKILALLKRGTVGLVLIVLLLAIVGTIYQTAAAESDKRKYPAPGVLVNVDGYMMHIYCTGAGSPTIILDAANMGTVSTWAWIQPEVAKTSRVCAYDRADSGWSDLSPQPNDTKQNAEVLHTLLQSAGESAPYVLVGHSLGGLYVRMYAEMYPDEVAGMVFIEATLPDGLNALGKPDVMPNSPDEGMIDTAPMVSSLGILRLMKFPSADPDLPEPQRSELQAFLSSAKWAELIKRQYHLFPTLLAQIRPLYGSGSLGNIPVAVVLSSEGDGSLAEWQDLWAQQAALSTNHIIVTIDSANHISLVDRQEHALQVSAIIIRVVEAARSGQPLE